MELSSKAVKKNICIQFGGKKSYIFAAMLNEEHETQTCGKE